MSQHSGRLQVLDAPTGLTLRLEEILETLEIVSDRQTLKALEEGLRDMKAGRVRSYADFAKELHRSHEL